MLSEVQEVTQIPLNSSGTRNQSNCKEKLRQHSSLHGNYRIVKWEERAALPMHLPHTAVSLLLLTAPRTIELML